MTINAQLYDASVGDWDGEIAFYRDLVKQHVPPHGAVLEIACGTGRVASRLAHDGTSVVGIDQSAEFLLGARAKTEHLPNAHWHEADMRDFQLDQRFDLIISPGHSFQYMLTVADQLQCLHNLKRHLAPNGRIVLHLDHLATNWLGDIATTKRGVFEQTKTLTHPENQRVMHVSEAWSYDRVSQIATLQTRRDIYEPDGTFVERREKTSAYHCFFPFEMEHVLARAGFQVQAVYGDFFNNPLSESSDEMIWIAQLNHD